jgi:hypothetical protein
MARTRKTSGVHLSWPKPTFSQVVKTNKNFKANYQGAIMYAHYELSPADLKREVQKYLKSVNPKHILLDKIANIDEKRFATVGKYTYVLNNHGDIPEEIFAGLRSALEKIVAEEASQATKIQNKGGTERKGAVREIPKVVITIQDRLYEKTREVAGEVEGWIDDFFLARKTAKPNTVEDFVNLFKSRDLKAPHMRFMHGFFQRRAAEIAKAATGKDTDLNEGYSNFTILELKNFNILHQNLLAACIMLQEVAKVERSPRKKKPVSEDKLVARLKYKKDDPTLGIVSLPPVQIIGSKEVWVYNTKTRKLAQYKALDADGLTVKGASLDNFSSDSAEKTVRKPAETLAEFKKASKVKLRTFLKELSTVDIPAQGKLNEHHIILRIDK